MNWKNGLPFGWWRNPDVWATAFSVLTLAVVGVLLVDWWLL